MTGAAITTTPPALGRARLARYALWQIKDFWINIGVVSIVLFGLLGMISFMELRALQAMITAQHRTWRDLFATQHFQGPYGMFAAVGPIIALSGIVSQDRTMGYARFLFAKPLSPLRFYAQSLLVRYLGYLVVGHVLLFAWMRYWPPVYTPRFVVDMTVSFVAVGGTLFLFSVLTKFDGLLTVLLLLVAELVWSKWETATTWKHWLTYPFPPVARFAEIHHWLLGINAFGEAMALPFATKWVAWSAGYGLACLLLGFYLLRRVSLIKA